MKTSTEAPRPSSSGPSPPPAPSAASSASISAPHPHAASATTHIPPAHPSLLPSSTHLTADALTNSVTHSPSTSSPTHSIVHIPPSSIPPPPAPSSTGVLPRVAQVGWWGWDLLAKPFFNGLFFGMGTHMALYTWQRFFLKQRPQLPYITDVHPNRMVRGGGKAEPPKAPTTAGGAARAAEVLQTSA